MLTKVVVCPVCLGKGDCCENCLGKGSYTEEVYEEEKASETRERPHYE